MADMAFCAERSDENKKTHDVMHIGHHILQFQYPKTNSLQIPCLYCRYYSMDTDSAILICS